MLKNKCANSNLRNSPKTHRKINYVRQSTEQKKKHEDESKILNIR